MTCQIAYGYNDRDDVLLQNPPYIGVVNQYEDDLLVVDNSHEYVKPINENTFQCADGISVELVGFWRIKYKL